VVGSNWPMIERLAHELVERRELDYDAFIALVGGW
jgi:hypothetical protein